MPEPIERKKRDHGPTLKYPLLQAADIARVLGVTRQAVCKYVRELNEERERLYEKALADLRRKDYSGIAPSYASRLQSSDADTPRSEAIDLSDSPFALRFSTVAMSTSAVGLPST